VARDTRARMIAAAVRSLQHDGAEGMSFTEVLRASGAARGAIYHHFPGGKSQLVAEAAAENGSEVRAALAQVPAESPAAVVRGFLQLIRPVVLESASGGGCAVAAAAMTKAGPDHDGPQQAAAVAIGSWISEIAGRFAAAGLAGAEARELASTLITMLEGAHVLARATGEMAGFDQTAHALTALVEGRYGR
jgi:TetR/AcrR family transcriptional regulator, lmrAB and yxaGH operons repressor